MHLGTHAHTQTSKEKCVMNFRESKGYLEEIRRISKWKFYHCIMLSIPCRNVTHSKHTISPSLLIPILLSPFTSRQISIPHPVHLDSLLLWLCDSLVLATCAKLFSQLLTSDYSITGMSPSPPAAINCQKILLKEAGPESPIPPWCYTEGSDTLRALGRHLWHLWVHIHNHNVMLLQ